jgi:hypothetical protein
VAIRTDAGEDERRLHRDPIGVHLRPASRPVQPSASG